jgi:Arc/MetJ-type ribon-helix-helix transcriptional regulator
MIVTIYLSKELQQFVHDAVRSGRYASADDMLNDAVERLRQQIAPDAPGGTAQVPCARSSEQAQSPMSEDDFKRRLLQSGLMSSLPIPTDPATRPDFQSITLVGEPISETIVRERR